MSHDLSLNVSQAASPGWIAGRVETLLSHFYRPSQAPEIEEAAMMDWISALKGYPQDRISAACDAYIRSGPSKRPAPTDIIAMMAEGKATKDKGDRSKLSIKELQTLEQKVLPSARRMLHVEALAEHGRKTLDYWGETI